ncbi:MAG TPA: NUDIX domain-containing protein [Thermodesulfovibrionales bacterium]|nr:NUDIX domain-containing protein [Thermodesulfovibrionales bacterium]
MLTEKIREEIIKAAFIAEKPADHMNKEEFAREYIEPINVIDEDDNTIGLEFKGLCHSLGLRHEAVFVLFISPDGKMLLKREKSGTDPEADLLDVAVEGHVGANEDIGACAVRKMKEKFDFSPEIGRMKFMTSYNRNCPPSLSKTREINNERRFLFKYFVSDAEMARLSGMFQLKDKDEAATLGWYEKGEVLEAIDLGRTTDELLMSFVHYLVYILPDSEIKIG